MSQGSSSGQGIVGRAADLVVSAVGHAAGTTVDPLTGLSKLRTALLTPAVAVAVSAAVLGYALGRRGRG